mgnify:CR=1 FL=1
MPYDFQKKRMQKGDWPDPIPLNKDFQTPAGVLNGRVDKDNLAEGAARSTALLPVAPADQAFVPWAVFEVLVPQSVGTHVIGYSYPSGTGGDHWAIPNDGNWSPIPLTSGGSTFMDVTTGTGGLDLTAFVQYLWLGFNATNIHTYNGDGDYAARVQFAVRLNGRIVEGSITGQTDPFHAPPRGERPVVHRQMTSGLSLTDEPGPQVEHTTNVGTNGPDYYGQRIGAYMEVQPGRHTIELVARRYGRSNTGVGYVSSKDVVYVHTRHGILQEVPFYPSAAVASADVQIPSMESEDVIRQGELYTKRAFVLQTRTNNLKEGNLARGALTHRHLPSAIFGATRGTFNVSGKVRVLSNAWPGERDTRSGKAHTEVGWYPLQTLSGDLFRTDNGINVVDKRGIIVVRADVQVPAIHLAKLGTWSAGAAPLKLTARWDVFAALCLGYVKTDGSTGIISNSFAYYNGWKWSNFATYSGASGAMGGVLANQREHLNCSLLGRISLTGSEAESFSYFQVLGCTIPVVQAVGASSSNRVYTSLRYHRGTISALHLRP